MTREGEGADGIGGRPLEEAVEAVVEATGDDPEEVRAALEVVAEEGVVRRSAVEPAVSHLSKVVSTPETRAEFARIELGEAREAATPVADVDAVRVRLDAIETRLDAVEADLEALGTDLQDLLGRVDAGDLYAIGTDVRRITAAANDLQRRADDLLFEAEDLQEWLADHETRREELDGDLEAVGEYLDGIEATIDEVEDGVADDEDLAVAWFDAALRHRAGELLRSDVRAERADLATLADREGLDDPDLAWADERIDDLDARLEGIDERIAEAARPEWRDRFGEELAGFEDALEDLGTPVDWGAVWVELDRHRPGA